MLFKDSLNTRNAPHGNNASSALSNDYKLYVVPTLLWVCSSLALSALAVKGLSPKNQKEMDEIIIGLSPDDGECN